MQKKDWIYPAPDIERQRASWTQKLGLTRGGRAANTARAALLAGLARVIDKPLAARRWQRLLAEDIRKNAA